MFAEVIRGRFGEDEAAGAPAYALPASAEIGLPVLDQAHAALLARLNAAHCVFTSGDEAWARLQLDMLRSDLATHFDIEADHRWMFEIDKSHHSFAGYCAAFMNIVAGTPNLPASGGYEAERRKVAPLT